MELTSVVMAGSIWDLTMASARSARARDVTRGIVSTGMLFERMCPALSSLGGVYITEIIQAKSLAPGPDELSQLAEQQNQCSVMLNPALPCRL